MAFLGAHNATIAGSQLAKTGIAVALIKTFFNRSLTGNAANQASKRQ
jgi:hypothetical protein